MRRDILAGWMNRMGVADELSIRGCGCCCQAQLESGSVRRREKKPVRVLS